MYDRAMLTMRSFLLLIFAVTILPAANTRAQQNSSKDTCLLFVARNISSSGPNYFLYYTFSNKRVDIRKGDVLKYDIYLSKSNPEPCGGIDIETLEVNLRDSGATDQNNLSAHPNTSLEPAIGHWYHREISLDKLVGQRARRWILGAEGDARGTYVQFVDNVLIARADGTKAEIYTNGPPTAHQVAMKEGYSKEVLLKPVPRAVVKDNVDLNTFVDAEVQHFAIAAKLDDLRAQIDLAKYISRRTNDPSFTQHVADANTLIDAAQKNEQLTADQIPSIAKQVDALVKQDEPVMHEYTAHMVGHAHIDFQWLWEWPETVQVCRETFRQALRFINEFPGFKFTQSSSGLYEATEKSWPEIFKGIQEQVAKGNWEIVGGRITEADENMESPESHAMQFLYGQRYFREHFKGVDAKVGWEPDTFGHTLQFPQILNLAGCKYFYFCRGGYNIPLFWWQSPDGSRVLAFDEPASGGWYDGDVTTNRFDRLFNFADKTGSKDMLWVYGVGDHGGGPTRENINTALSYQKLPFLPTVKFDTVLNFFHSLEKYDLSKLPVCTTDLNTGDHLGFNGVWTTHSDVKRWNRDAEAITESAEAIAFFSSRYGYPYPAEELRHNWEDICWNHHHDTISGTAFHNSYYRTGPMFERVIASSRQIAQDALSFLAVRVQSSTDGILVFNPTGWARTDIVTFGEKVNGESDAVSLHDREPMQNTADGKCIFLVKDIPPYSYRVYHIEPHQNMPGEIPIALSQDNRAIGNHDFKITLNSAGEVTSIFDNRLKREFIAKGGTGNRLEIHWENPHGSSAWTIGRIDRVEPLQDSAGIRVEEAGPVRITLGWDRKFQSSVLHQTISLGQYGPPEFSLSTQWNELGSVDHHEPFLKVAFDIAGSNPVATYQVPYATIQKPIDGAERPASKFADLSGDGLGAAILNDCKQGYSADGNTLRLSLIRTSYYPDPRPNDRPQHASWIFFPHDGNGDSPAVAQAAESFNHPLMCTAFHAIGGASLPPEQTFLSVNAPNVLITGVKRAQDDGDLIVRFYELVGKPTTATFTLPATPTRIQTVNLIEDPLHDDKSSTVQLRGHEIRTLKIALPPVPGYN